MNKNLYLILLISLAVILVGCSALDMLNSAVTTVAPDGAIDAPTIDTIIKYRTGNITLLSFALILLSKGLYIYKLYKDKKGLGSIVKVLVGSIEGQDRLVAAVVADGSTETFNPKKSIVEGINKDLAGKQESLVLHQIVKKNT